MTDPVSEIQYTALRELNCRRKEGLFKAVMGVSWLPNRLGANIYPHYLSAGERQEADVYLLPSRQQAFLKGRYITKKALAAFLQDEDYQQHIIRTGIFGQPLLETPHRQKPGISISHSGSLAACLVYDEAHPMALDLEKIELAKAEIIKSQLSSKELQLCREYGEDWSLTSLRLWSMKEALSKVLKTGLSADFKLFELEVLERDGPVLTGSFRNFMQYKALCWLQQDYVWALVLPAQSTLTAPEVLFSILPANMGS